MSRKLIVTHHAPDLDAITSVWILKRFDSQHFADAKLDFVNPGEKISLEEAEKMGCQLHEVTHVDTGLGKFDHHQPERSNPQICAASLVYDHVCQVHPDLKNDKSLREIVSFATQVDHFEEIYWPEADNMRYNFMIHELIRGMEFHDPHNDESQMHFGMTCLDSVYATLTQRIKADEIIDTKGMEFEIKTGKALAMETRNDDTLKLAQKRGFGLVVRKDSKLGNIRVKVRPDVDINLTKLYEKIISLDQVGTWYNHPSGKMLLNGSSKHRQQKPSPLALAEVITLIKEIYG